MTYRRMGALAMACLVVPLCGWPSTHQEAVWPKSYVDGATRKLGRAVANIFTSPLELVRKPRLTARRESGFSAFTVGVAQGVRAMATRFGAGVAELLTAPVPFPDAQFQPIVQPEFIYAHGDWAPD